MYCATHWTLLKHFLNACAAHTAHTHTRLTQPWLLQPVISPSNTALISGTGHMPSPPRNNHRYTVTQNYTWHTPDWHPFGLPSQQAIPPPAPAAVVEAATADGARSGRTAPTSPLFSLSTSALKIHGRSNNTNTQTCRRVIWHVPLSQLLLCHRCCAADTAVLSSQDLKLKMNNMVASCWLAVCL